MTQTSLHKSVVCRICNSLENIVAYEGPIRAGRPGNSVAGQVTRCAFCGVERLAEEFCLQSEGYRTIEYREQLGQGTAVSDFLKHADPNQLGNLEALLHLNFRSKTIADVGSGAGSFLDHISGISSVQIAVEPTERYHQSLTERGYKVFSYVGDALEKYEETVDIVVSLQVIEHVDQPNKFLADLARLLRPGGVLVISTPNRSDILMELASEHFPSFFYRTQHRWYFDKASLLHCCETALKGKFSDLYLEYHHTLGFSNTLHWLQTGLPRGNERIDAIGQEMDSFWKVYLKSTERADSLFVFVTKAA